jgi:hypothetical protein
MAKKGDKSVRIRGAFGFEVVPEDGTTVVPRAATGNYAALAEGARTAFENTCVQASRAGVTHYRWRSCGDSDVCPQCRKNDGRRFSFSKPPGMTGHPGDGRCCDHGHCRCYAEPIV